MTTELRWILIVCGATLLVGIYLWGRRTDRRRLGSDDAVARPRPEPQFEPAPKAPAYASLSDADRAEADLHYGDEPDDPPIRAASRQEERIPVAGRADESLREGRRGRVEPTFNETDLPSSMGYRGRDDDVEVDPALTVELPSRESRGAPTLTMSSTPAPRRIERRKIIALRLAAPAQRYPGDALRHAMEAESLQFGRYEVFHRLNDAGASIFSVASMVEPGTFELDRMAGQQYAGVTMFTQLPGPIPGVHALHDLVTCGKRLQEVLGGTLQDERGVPLTVHRIDRIRQEIVDFERGQARDNGQRVEPPVS